MSTGTAGEKVRPPEVKLKAKPLESGNVFEVNGFRYFVKKAHNRGCLMIKRIPS